mgnify:CR=1 FL=1
MRCITLLYLKKILKPVNQNSGVNLNGDKDEDIDILNSNIKNVYVADYFLCINEKSSNYSKKEDIIWWSNDICKNEEFKDKNIFEYHGITFNIIDCCNFINKINDKNYDLSKSQNRQLLIDN